MSKYKATSRGILKDGHTMFAEDIVKELNNIDHLRQGLRLMEGIVLPKKALIAKADKLKESLLSYDDWEDRKALDLFVEKYAGKEVNVFTKDYEDYFIVEDNNVVMCAGTFGFI